MAHCRRKSGPYLKTSFLLLVLVSTLHSQANDYTNGNRWSCLAFERACLAFALRVMSSSGKPTTRHCSTTNLHHYLASSWHSLCQARAMKRRHKRGTGQGNKRELGSATSYMAEMVRKNNTVSQGSPLLPKRILASHHHEITKTPPPNNNYLASKTMQLLEEHLPDNETEWGFLGEKTKKTEN